MSRKHKKHQEDDPDPEFQVAPMVDVLLVLLMFFMSITSTEVLKKVADLELPEAIHSKDVDKNRPGGEVVINITLPEKDRPAFSVDQTSYRTPEDIGPFLKERLAQSPNLRVLIRADQNIEYRTLADIMKIVGKSNIGNVTFAVLTAKEAKAAP